MNTKRRNYTDQQNTKEIATTLLKTKLIMNLRRALMSAPDTEFLSHQCFLCGTVAILKRALYDE